MSVLPDDRWTAEEVRTLPEVTGLRPDLAQAQAAVPVSRGERIFRGMLGMGTTFAAVAAALMIPLAAVTLISGVDRDDLDFMIVATFGWIAIAFGLGMLSAGLLAIMARGRSFREVTIARVAAAGAAVGLIPFAVVAVGSMIGPGTLTMDEVLSTIVIFPPTCAAIATASLLIARRAKPEPGTGD